jgi:hypothetical protein
MYTTLEVNIVNFGQIITYKAKINCSQYYYVNWHPSIAVFDRWRNFWILTAKQKTGNKNENVAGKLTWKTLKHINDVLISKTYHKSCQ